MSEQWLVGKSAAEAKALMDILSKFPNNGLEAAADYMNAGLWGDGTDVLKLLIDATADKSKVLPLAYYYLGYFADQLNQPDRANQYDQLAAKAPVDYVFPFQMEMIPVLEHAMAQNPSDARAPYYLGDLLFDWQPARAAAMWEKSASLGADFPVVYRNLAMVYKRQGNQRHKEIAALEKAIQFGGNALVIDELDKLYEQKGVAPEKRLALMESHQSVINRDEVIAREVNLDIFAGKPDAAIQLLQSRFFRAWEGGARFSLGDAWINAHLVSGRQHMATRQYALALADFEAAIQTPSNLREALGTSDLGSPVDVAGSRKAELFYSIGSAYDAMGNTEKAKQLWRVATESSTAEAAASGASDLTGQFSGHAALGGEASGARVSRASAYYQALAFEELGQTTRARQILRQLIHEGTQVLNRAADAPASKSGAIFPADRAQVADAHYLVGLGELGLKENNKARKEFSIALQDCPDHMAAHMALAELSQKP
jgi:tetratricopeptide (TPR) repeat protein